MTFAVRPLSSVLQYIRGVTFDPDELISGDEPGAIACMRTKNVQKVLDASDLIYVPKSVINRDEQFLRTGDLLISSANSWELVGKTVKVDELAYPATAGGFISILRPNSSIVIPDYLYRFISWDKTQHAIRHLGRQTTNISNLDRERFLALPIPLPPIETQKHIVRVLEQADQLRKQAQQMESELNQLAQSLFLEMFGDPVTNPRAWRKVPLADVAEVQGGLQVTHRREFLPIEAPYLRVANVFRDRIELEEVKTIRVTEQELERTALQKGDMLVVEGHGNKDEIGRTSIWEGALDVCTHQNHLIRVRFDQDKVIPQFVSIYLNSSGGREQIRRLSKTTSGLNTISTNNVKSFALIVPDLKTQQTFIEKYGAIQARLSELGTQRDTYNKLFESLMQRAFNGELTAPGSKAA